MQFNSNFRKIYLVFIYFFVFISGSAGLIYEVVWQKYLSRLLGSDSTGSAIILAVFLGGLSCGYYIFGKLSTKIKNTFRFYAFLELGIGAWGIIFPRLFSAIFSATYTWSFSPPVLIVIQGLVCTIILIGIPTILMGGTIPILVRGISRTLDESTKIHAFLYGINTAGAFIGTLAAGFLLIPVIGLPLTVMTSAMMNIMIALFFYFTSHFAPKIALLPDYDKEVVLKNQEQKDVREISKLRYSPSFLYAIAFLSGFYVMALENVIMRLVGLSIGSSSYSFTMVVSSFIFSIAAGSLIVGKMKNIPRSLLFFNQICITFFLILIYLTLDSWPYLAHVLRVSFQSNDAGFIAYWVSTFLVLLLTLFIPAGLMGATVPIAFHEIKRDFTLIGKYSGYLFSFNTIGNLIGSLAGGIILYNFMDIPEIFSLTILMASISSILAGSSLSKKHLAWSGILTAFSIFLLLKTPAYDKSHFVKGTFRIREAQASSFNGPRNFFKNHLLNMKVLYYDDGSDSTVSVISFIKLQKILDFPSLSIMVNGKSDSSTTGDVYTIKLLAHIPALLAQNRGKVMIIGLGTGVTAGEISLYPDVKRIDVAEISNSVIKALPIFSKANHNIHKDKRLHIHFGDAFRIIGRSKERWDIIISEPSNPWVTGVDALFTIEFYDLVKEHLASNGILMQWIHRYESRPEVVGMVINTLRNEFNNLYVFIANEGDLLILASNYSISREDLKKASKNFENFQKVRDSLSILGISSFDSILVRQLWTSGYADYYFRDYGLQTMDNPRLHYMAGKQFFMGSYIADDFFLSADSAFYVDEYLMTLLNPSWATSPITSTDLEMFLRSFNKELGGDFHPITESLKFKKILSDFEEFSNFSETWQKKISPEIFKIITNLGSEKGEKGGGEGNNLGSEREGSAKEKNNLGSGEEGSGEEVWKKAGLWDLPLRKKVEVMEKYIAKTRNWIIPYPLDGLKSLLTDCIKKESNAQENNWCRIKYAHLLSWTPGGIEEAKKSLKSLIINSKGDAILNEQDKILLKSVIFRIERLELVEKERKRK